MTLDTDYFEGTDGDPWAAGWTFTEPSGSGPYTELDYLSEDLGTTGLVGTTIAAQDLYAVRTADSLTDADVRIAMVATNATTGNSMWAGLLARYASPTVCYRARINYLSGDLELHRNDSLVASTTPSSFPAQWQMRLQVTTSGSDALVKVKFWQYTNDEPSDWAIEYTDTSPLAAGKCGLYFDFGASTYTVNVDAYSRNDLSTGAVSANAAVAAISASALDASAGAGTIVAAQEATFALEAPFVEGTVIFVDVESSDPVEVTLAAQDAGGAVKASAEAATLGVAGETAGAGAGPGSSASTATFAIAGVNAGPGVSPSAEAVAVAMAATDATVTALATGEAAGGEADLAVTAADAGPSVGAAADHAGASLDAQNATVNTTAATNPHAGFGRFLLDAFDATVVAASSPAAEVASIGLTARDATVEAVSPSGRFYFQPPVAYDRPPSVPWQPGPQGRLAHRLMRHYGGQPRGRSVLKLDGVYVTLDHPTQHQIDAASEAYIGGHVYLVEPAVALALQAAGYTVTEEAA